MTKENLQQSIGAAALAFPWAPLSSSTLTAGFLVAMGLEGRAFIYLPLDVFAS